MSNKIFVSIVVALLVVPAHQAAAVYKPAITNKQNTDLVQKTEKELKAGTDLLSEECADPDVEGSLGEAQKEAIEDQKKMATSSIDIGRSFDIGKKNGCFSSLSDFPDLSIGIPSLTAILESIKGALVDYATRKVCSAVNDALTEALNPISDALNSISDKRQLDLSGRVNREMMKKMYEFDSELGRQAKAPQPAEKVEFKW